MVGGTHHTRDELLRHQLRECTNGIKPDTVTGYHQLGVQRLDSRDGRLYLFGIRTSQVKPSMNGIYLVCTTDFASITNGIDDPSVGTTWQNHQPFIPDMDDNCLVILQIIGKQAITRAEKLASWSARPFGACPGYIPGDPAARSQKTFYQHPAQVSPKSRQ